MEDRADIRKDFIKRLFSVAISVGFVATFIEMPWVKTGSLPTGKDYDQICILIIGLFATVFSWDNYLLSIEAKPLKEKGRFWIDILLVFFYLFLLVTSKHSYLWLWALACIFFLYVVWDIFTIREYRDKYDISLMGSAKDEPFVRANARDILKIYGKGLLDDPKIERGPIITLSWMLFFVCFAFLYSHSYAGTKVKVACLLAGIALILYRIDKERTLEDERVHGFKMYVRCFLIIALLAAFALYSCRFGRSL